MIREIKPEDDPMLGEVIQAALKDNEERHEVVDTVYSPKNYQISRDVMQTKGKYWVYDYEGKIIGGIGMHPLKTQKGVIELGDFYVHPDSQDKDVGQDLLEHAINYAKTEKYEMIYLETHDFYQAANHLYEKNGFEELDEPLTHSDEHDSEKWYGKKL